MKLKSGKVRVTGASLSVPCGEKTQASGLEVQLSQESLGPFSRYVLTARAEKATHLVEVLLEGNCALGEADRIMPNGFQSWTESREFRPDERILRMPLWARPLYQKHHLEPYGDYSIHKYASKKGLFHGYTYCLIRHDDGAHTLIASLSQNMGYGSIELDGNEGTLEFRTHCQGVELQASTILADVFIGRGMEAALFDTWFELLGIPLIAAERPLAGWTSWYLHYTSVSEQIVLANLESFSLAEIPLDIFQIDDGWQGAVGDWLQVNQKFPRGLAPLAADIQSKGYKAGLWLAPFICEQNSELFKTHSSWLLRDNQGQPVVAGNNAMWSGRFYALDIDNAEFRDYLKSVFSSVLQHFDMVKLDFLYAAALCPKPGEVASRVMTRAMHYLREWVGDKKILACGVPLGAALGNVDYCRIGPDVSLGWEEPAPAMIHFRERISTVTAICNTIYRRQLGYRAFLNDPDVFMLRSEKTSLTWDEQYALLLANALFGQLLFTSDDIRAYSARSLQLLRSLFPLQKPEIIGVKSIEGVYNWQPRNSLLQAMLGAHPYENVMVVDFAIAKRTYIAVFNLGSQTIEAPLPAGCYFDGSSLVENIVALKPRSACCLYRVQGTQFEVLGGQSHIFWGADAQCVEMDGESAQVCWQSSSPLALAVGPKPVVINGQMLTPRPMGARWVVWVHKEKHHE